MNPPQGAVIPGCDGFARHAPECRTWVERPCAGCGAPWMFLRMLCDPDRIGEERCTACIAACPNCVSEVRVSPSGRHASVAHQDDCEWWIGHQARRSMRHLASPGIPCGVSVKNRGPYKLPRRPAAPRARHA